MLGDMVITIRSMEISRQMFLFLRNVTPTMWEEMRLLYVNLDRQMTNRYCELRIDELGLILLTITIICVTSI